MAKSKNMVESPFMAFLHHELAQKPPVGELDSTGRFAQGAVKTSRVCCHCQAFWHAEIAALKLTTSGLSWNLAAISQQILRMVPTFVADPTRRFLKSWGIPKVTMGFTVPPLKNGAILDDISGWLWTPPFAFKTLATEKKQWISGKFQRRYTPGHSGQTAWINWAYGTPMN